MRKYEQSCNSARLRSEQLDGAELWRVPWGGGNSLIGQGDAEGRGRRQGSEARVYWGSGKEGSSKAVLLTLAAPRTSQEALH